MKKHAFKYPENPGWKDSTVSKENAEAGRITFTRMQARVLALYVDGFTGTADEAAERLHLSPFSTRPRCTELVKMGQLSRLRIDRSTPGRSAWVLGYALAPADIRDLFGEAESDGQPTEQEEWHDFDRDC